MGNEGVILELLRKEPMTIDSVAKRLKINRITASKYLAIMEAKGLLMHEEVGRAKMYSLVKKK